MLNKQYTPAILAVLLILWATYCDYSGIGKESMAIMSAPHVTKEEGKLRWAELVHEYEYVINQKKLDYDTVNTKDLGIKSYNNGEKFVCPLKAEEECKIRYLDNGSFVVYTPKIYNTVILVGNAATVMGGREARDLFIYYKDEYGKLRVKAETYDVW